MILSKASFPSQSLLTLTARKKGFRVLPRHLLSFIVCSSYGLAAITIGGVLTHHSVSMVSTISKKGRSLPFLLVG